MLQACGTAGGTRRVQPVSSVEWGRVGSRRTFRLAYSTFIWCDVLIFLDTNTRRRRSTLKWINYVHFKTKYKKKRNTQRKTKNKKMKRKKKHRQADYLNEMILWIEKWPPGIWDKIKRVCLANQSEPNQTERTLPNWTVPQRSARPRQTRPPVCHRPSLWLVGSPRNKTKILMHIPVCMCVCQYVCVWHVSWQICSLARTSS